ncbi:MAG TPA: hypothetical protein VJ673_03930 [Aromatoleum sp.]|uniref:hypothetical protein n=1 Tax=Aromatoleum sp. TaxID=2307007 RepID=UPI002B4A0029|nr:hypothetical protein [Aromatoleum sp.]HJV24807.1 hypothetical protein [Aromatoleum sp.]
MPPRVIPFGVVACLALLVTACAWAQAAPPAAGNSTGTASVPEGKRPGKGAATKAPPFRDTTGYRYPAISRTVRDMQNMAYAMQLRDYCADERVPDEFVKEQLSRFSRITGREETCRSLLAY